VTEEWPDVSIIFFKLKKVQMQAVTGQVNVAVCKQKKIGGKIMTAGQLRDQLRDIEKLIQQHNGYQILKTVTLLASPYWESAQKDLMAMIRQLGLATLFVTLSSAETRWPHLLKLLAHINYNRQLTDEQCHHLSCGEKCRLISTDLNTCDDSLTMTQFLQLINLGYEHYVLATKSTIRSDILFL
jgi:hypothetical protein